MAAQRYTVVFSVAVLVAAAATYEVYHALQKTKEASQVPTQPVVVAAQDVQEGQRLEGLNLRVDQWPAATIPPGTFAASDSVVGRVTRVAVFKGEPIVPGRLAPAGAGPGLEIKIAPGKRAMAVKINDVVGLAGLIQPNSRVDVLVTLKEEGSQDKQRAKLFMNDVRVLSVGSQVERGEDGKPIVATTAALEVTPAEAERLAVAMNQGSIQLVLRGYGDPDSVRTPGATEADVLAQLRLAPVQRFDAPTPAPPARRITRVARVVPAAPPAVTPPVHLDPPVRHEDTLVVQVYRGAKLEQQKFKAHDSTSTTTATARTP